MLCGQESSGGSQLHLLVPAKEDVSAWEASQAGGVPAPWRATAAHAEDSWGEEWMCASEDVKPKDVYGRPGKHVEQGPGEHTCVVASAKHGEKQLLNSESHSALYSERKE